MQVATRPLPRMQHPSRPLDCGVDGETLPDVLAKLDRLRLEGVLEVQGERHTRRLFVRPGKAVFASSVDPKDSLGAHLARRKVLDEKTVQELARSSLRQGKRMGVLLVAEGLMTPRQVHDHICRQAREILDRAFSRPIRSMVFFRQDVDDANAIKICAPLAQLVLEGSQRIADTQLLLQRLGGRRGRPEPIYSLERLIDVGVDEAGMALLERVDGRRDVEDLCTRGPRSAVDNLRTLYAFRALELVATPEPDLRRRSGDPKRPSGPYRLKQKAPRPS